MHNDQLAREHKVFSPTWLELGDLGQYRIPHSSLIVSGLDKSEILARLKFHTTL